MPLPNYSHSYLSTFRDCPLRCRFQYELRLRKREEEASEHHLRYGRAGHLGLQQIYLGNGLQAAQEVFLCEYSTQLDPNDLAKTRANGVAMLEQYVERWKDEDRKWEVLEVEGWDQAEDGFVTKLDLIARNRETDEVFGWDHKIVGGRHKYLSYEYWGQFEPNSQINEYVRRLLERYGSCGGFVINAIGMNHTTRASKNGPAGFHPRYERQVFNPSPETLKAEVANRAYYIQQVEMARATGAWGYNTNSCYNCAYKPICAAGWSWENDQELIEIQYYQRCTKGKCVLERGHEGDCSEWLLPAAEPEFDIDPWVQSLNSLKA